MAAANDRRVHQSMTMMMMLWFSLMILSADALALNPTTPTGIFSIPTEPVDWDVYVDQSRSAVSRGSTATLDAFVGLAPPSVEVHPSVISSSSRSKSPTVRCRSRTNPEDCLEIVNVDSVDKVYRILTRHLNVQVSCFETYCQSFVYKTCSSST